MLLGIMAQVTTKLIEQGINNSRSGFQGRESKLVTLRDAKR